MGEEVGTMQFRVQGEQKYIYKEREKEKKWWWVYKKRRDKETNICIRKEKNISMYDIKIK
jgi:hypothetical protein